jgi:hypothetical protein
MSHNPSSMIFKDNTTSFTRVVRVVEVARKNMEVLNNHKYMEIFSCTTKYGGQSHVYVLQVVHRTMVIFFIKSNFPDIFLESLFHFVSEQL